MSEIVNRRDLDFLLYEFLDLEALCRSPRYDAYDRVAVDEILNAAQVIAEDKFLSFAAKLDATEPLFEGGKAICIPEVKEALDAYAEAGFFAAGFDEDIGGLQMPNVLCLAMNGMFSCANHSVFGYSMLTTAAANMLDAFGSDEQKSVYLPPMLEGRWFGTMCLSEPQAGSSLSDIRTRARPRADGSYSISGTKMWISGGEQEISENIVHMVLAKIAGGPEGVKGISLFIVPKYRVNADGLPAEKNNIALAGLNHKMGQRGITNTLLNFGEGGETQGFLVGEQHQGLRYMFHMMNEARIAVGHGAAVLGLAGYLYSLDYAQHRLQGRHPQDKDPSSPQVPIVEHADIKRMLLTQKAYVEGALALVLYCAYLLDRQKTSDDVEAREEIGLLLEILTPIAKSWPSEYCLEANKLAIQILGGYGYARDYPVERFYRDNRLNPIHEGSHGIQGIDLLGRKVRIQDGAALKILAGKIKETVAEACESEFADEAGVLRSALEELMRTTRTVLACNDIALRLANATLYLDATGHIVIAWMWLKQALAVPRKIAATHSDSAFYSGKHVATRFFFRYELPKVFPILKIVASLDDTALSITPTEFIG